MNADLQNEVGMPTFQFYHSFMKLNHDLDCQHIKLYVLCNLLMFPKWVQTVCNVPSATEKGVLLSHLYVWEKYGEEKKLESLPMWTVVGLKFRHKQL